MEGMLIESGKQGGKISFNPRGGSKKVGIGDLVYLCETDRLKNAGLLGVASLASQLVDTPMPIWQERFWIGKNDDADGSHSVRHWMEVLFVCHQRLPRKEFKSNPILSTTHFAKGYQGTMRGLPRDAAEEIDRLIGFVHL